MWALQQAARDRQRASRASNRRRVRRICNGRLRTHYRDKGRGSSHAGAGRDRRLTVDGRPTGAKNRRKMMEARHFSQDRMRSWGGHIPRSRAAIRNRDLLGSESVRRRNRINFTRFRRGVRQTPGENSAQGSGLASRMPCRCRAVCVLSRPQGPEKLRLNAGYRISAAHEECARSAGASKWPRRVI